ncbi:g7592 [Coccomyxa viridis]|uniref:G7592 protein n=1 Tax=Coccomyxa viridis TaxID=1274662 RepID=A0ABP1FYA4_9CHLO
MSPGMKTACQCPRGRFGASSARQVCRAQMVGGSSKSATLQDGQSPQDMLKVFAETQKNMMELNRSRLAALEEVRTLRERVSQLDAKVKELESDAYSGRRQSFTGPGLALHDEPGAYVPQDPVNGQGRPNIHLSYLSGWTRAFVHYNVDGQGWTELPGTELRRDERDPAGARTIVIPGKRLEFVMTNAEGGWDTPDPYSGGKKNYVIEAPGRYHLKSGRLQQLA